MRFFTAVVCPPLAFLLCGRPVRAAIAAVAFVAAVLTVRSGIGLAIDFALILWAIGSVGDEDAKLEARGFVAGVTGSRHHGRH